MRDTASELSHELLGPGFRAHCEGFEKSFQTHGKWLSDSCQVHVGVVAVLSEKIGHPGWVCKARIFEWGASENRNSIQVGHKLLEKMDGRQCEHKIDIAILCNLAHTMCAIHIDGEILVVDGLRNQCSEFRPSARAAQEQFSLFNSSEATTQFLKPWKPCDDESCGCHVFHCLRYLVFESMSVKEGLYSS